MNVIKGLIVAAVVHAGYATAAATIAPDTKPFPLVQTSTQGVLMVGVERRVELERVARTLADHNVVLMYRGKDGRFYEWKPGCAAKREGAKP